MKKFISLIIIVAISLSCYSQKIKPTNEFADPNWIAGTWKLVSVKNIYPDGSLVYPYGIDPKGLLMFDYGGNYTLQIYSAVRIMVASGDKNNCTPEENAALVKGSNSHFGQYLVDEAQQSITFKIAYASFPNWNADEQKRSYTYQNDQLTYVVTNTTQGGKSVVAEVIWKRCSDAIK